MVATALLVGLLFANRAALHEPASSALKFILGGGLLVSLLVLGRPDDTRSERKARVLVECLLGYPASARTRCNEAGGSYRARSCGCLFRRPPSQAR